MEALYTWLNTLVNNNKSDFAEWPEINWLNSYNSLDYQAQRDVLLTKVGDSVLFKDTKPFYNQISKGCTICGQGKWSCLFITNKCNAGCFYCPAPQNQDEVPYTQGLDFDNPKNYADYIKHFDFKGVSFSGGEPLLFFERTLGYLQQVRATCKDDVYIWMYTNGLLATKENMTKLALAGLDEIRFDIGATALSLDKVKIARGIIPNVTIEIPAIPEEKERLKQLLPEMVKAGVSNLNLHQLRLTAHNARQLVKRGYTIINAEKPIVLESELTALEIVNYAAENQIDIGINYCSFYFKNRFQQAGFRKQIARVLASPDKVVTESGFVREYKSDIIRYYTIKLYENKPNLSTINELKLPGKTYYYRKEIVFEEKGLSKTDIEKINQLLENEPVKIPEDDLLFKIWQLEYIEKGLREY